jgi:hypothetical protein
MMWLFLSNRLLVVMFMIMSIFYSHYMNDQSTAAEMLLWAILMAILSVSDQMSEKND